MLSLTPRFDLFVIKLPKEFIPEEIRLKYNELINQDKNVFDNSIDYLNESIVGITLPGLDGLLVEQTMHGQHEQMPSHRRLLRDTPTDVEASRVNYTYTTENPLSKIADECTITFRQNQGLYNYFMLYETLMMKIKRPECVEHYEKDDVLSLSILDERGIATTKIKFFQPRFQGLDGLTFSYNKTERQVETFDLRFKYNNVEFEFLPNKKEEEE